MPTTIKNPDSGQVKFAQDWELESYKAIRWVVDETATQDADGINKNPDSGSRDQDDDKDAAPTKATKATRKKSSK